MPHQSMLEYLLSSWRRAIFWISPTFMSRLLDEKLLSDALLIWSSSPTLSQDTARPLRLLLLLLPSWIENVQFRPDGVMLLDRGAKWNVAFISVDFWRFIKHGSDTLRKVAFKSGSVNFTCISSGSGAIFWDVLFLGSGVNWKKKKKLHKLKFKHQFTVTSLPHTW